MLLKTNILLPLGCITGHDRAEHVEQDETKVTLKCNPKTDTLQRAVQKANMKCMLSNCDDVSPSIM